MSNLITIAGLLFLSAVPVRSADSIRIGLFSLFKPEALHVRIHSGAGATLNADGKSYGHPVAPGDSIKVRLAHKNLSIHLFDSYGRAKQSIVSRRARISFNGPGAFELKLPGKIERVVRGQLEISAREASSNGPLRIVLTTDRESAIASIVAAEIGENRAPEAIKALSIVVRTFMHSESARHPGEGFDFCDTTHCEVYRGEDDLSAERGSPVIADAVWATEGEVLSFGGNEIPAYFTAACGGLTATPEMVWGGANGSDYRHQRIACRYCEGARHEKWERAARISSVLDALSTASGVTLSQAAEILVEKEESNGFVRSVVIRDRGRETRMRADEFRRHIGRRLGWNTVLSPTFQIERRAHSFVFRGRGFGSQVGMCLAGAGRQAAAGRTYREILSFYYPQAEISK